MSITLAGDTLLPVISLAAGVTVLLLPRLASHIIAAYLILVGALGLIRF